MFFEKKDQNENIPSEAYDKMIDDVLSEDTDGEKNENTDTDVAESFALTDEVSSEEPNNVSLQPSPTHKWHNDTLNRLDKEHKAHTESEIDHDLLLALGYVDNSKDKGGADSKKSIRSEVKSPENLYGMQKEYHDVREIPYIKEQFDRDSKKLNIRLIGTAASVLLLLIYPMICTLLKGKVDFFDADRFVGANLLISVELMLIAAAFSAVPLLSGLRGVFTMKPSIYSPSAMLILFQTAICIACAFLVSERTSAHMSLYCLPAAFSLLFPILSEKMQFNRQSTAFSAIAKHEETGRERWALTLKDGGAVLVKNAFPDGFAKLTKTPYTEPKLMNLTLIPLSALSIIAGLVTFFTSNSAEAAFSISSLCFSLSLIPVTAAFGYSSFYIVTKELLDPSEAVLVGRTSTDALADIDCVTVSEKEIFGAGSADTINMELYNDANLFDLLYFSASALKGRDLPFSHIFTASAEDIELSDNCIVTESADDGFCTLVDGNRTVHIGNAEYLRRNGMSIPYADTEHAEDAHTTPLFIALDNKPISYFCIDYNPCEQFLSFVALAAEEGVKIRIISSDFCVTRELIRTKLHLKDDTFELVKSSDDETNCASALTFAVSNAHPEPLAQIGSVCRTVKKAKKILGVSCIATVALSVLLAAVMTVFKLFFLSPYIILILSSVLLGVPALLVKGYLSGNI